jgi:hypothetical protein
MQRLSKYNSNAINNFPIEQPSLAFNFNLTSNNCLIIIDKCPTYNRKYFKNSRLK